MAPEPSAQLPARDTLPKKRPPTWIELAILTAGFRDALRALSWALTWGIVREALGHDPTVEEVADWWKEPLRTAYREQASFRKAYPALDTPAPIVDTEQASENIRKIVRAANELDEARAKKDSRIDRAILSLGMHPAQTN